MSFQDQAEKIMQAAPKCTAAGCPEKAVDVVEIAGKPVPYCKTHVLIWKQYKRGRGIYVDIMERTAKDERKSRP